MALKPKQMTMFAVALILLTAIVLVARAPLAAFNALVPADTGAGAVKTGVPYGPLPRQTLDIYAPAGRSGRHPVVVVFYGGSWNSGRRQDYAFLGQAFASRGFVTVIADYRLVPEVRFPAFLEDGARAVAWAYQNAEQFGGDRDRLFLFGHSAGAYIAAMIGLDGHYLTANGSSPAIVKGVAALAGPYDFLPFDTDSAREAFGQASDLALTQPINYVSAAAPPMFLATGDADTTVRPLNTKRLAEKLTRAGQPVTEKIYPGVGHVGIMIALSVPFRAKAPVLDDVVVFFAQHGARP